MLGLVPEQLGQPHFLRHAVRADALEHIILGTSPPGGSARRIAATSSIWRRSAISASSRHCVPRDIPRFRRDSSDVPSHASSFAQSCAARSRPRSAAWFRTCRSAPRRRARRWRTRRPLSDTNCSTSFSAPGFSDPSKMRFLAQQHREGHQHELVDQPCGEQRRIERAAALDEQVAALAFLEFGDRLAPCRPTILWLFSQLSGSSEWVSTYLLMRWNFSPIGLSWLYGQ